jgi:hypothetical protein
MFVALLVDVTGQTMENSFILAVAAAYQKENSFILPQDTRECKPRKGVGV